MAFFEGKKFPNFTCQVCLSGSGCKFVGHQVKFCFFFSVISQVDKCAKKNQMANPGMEYKLLGGMDKYFAKIEWQ